MESILGARGQEWGMSLIGGVRFFLRYGLLFKVRKEEEPTG
jgi:hypothetical protein